MKRPLMLPILGLTTYILWWMRKKHQQRTKEPFVANAAVRMIQTTRYQSNAPALRTQTWFTGNRESRQKQLELNVRTQYPGRTRIEMDILGRPDTIDAFLRLIALHFRAAEQRLVTFELQYANAQFRAHAYVTLDFTPGQ